ncbi:GerMN domain-containing protein [Crassaminicella thermophila]|uniref:GerMN domain-containing protein n=1 Tax=Crassaminicella thermophila TaxID=2599308 RepID=A0A5C0SH09_CRATE|nr:GerMN domain-containing protein [Crassaminicella thermophila]QEK12957.1 GerMN domain-containing protein [Crassaminicella thermophila]
MKRNRVVVLILVLCMMISLVGCANPIKLVTGLFGDEDKAASNLVESNDGTQQDDGLRNTVLYYKDDKGFLVPVMRKIPWTEGRGIAKAALRAMIDNPANRQDIAELGLSPVIPANTEIRGMSIHEGLCKVDFTSDFLNCFSKEEEEALVKAVVYTLTEFPTIDRVQFMVDGKIQNRLQYGTTIANAVTRKDINYVGKTPSDNKVVVYYEGTVNGLETYFVPVTKAIEKNDSSVNVLDALDALVEGPPKGLGLYSEIPEGTRVVSVDVNDSVACINLSEEILDIVDNQTAANSVAKSFGLTIKEQYPNVVGVKLFVDGKELKIGEEKKEDPIAIPTFANQY